MGKLTRAKLEGYGFKCIREPDKKRDEQENGKWYKDGITIWGSAWEEDSFIFAGRTDENDEFKSGWSIGTEEKLKALYAALMEKELE